MITIDPIKRPPKKSSTIDKDELRKEILQIINANKSEVYTKSEIDNMIISTLNTEV